MPDNKSAVRLLLPVRDEILPPRTLDRLLPAGHNARLVWHFVQGLDISALPARYRCPAHAHEPGDGAGAWRKRMCTLDFCSGPHLPGGRGEL